jgi:type IV secretory pathway TraG/TraD family ATPase VirD4
MQHLVVTGPTGSGKSMVFASLIAQDIAAGRPLVLVDPKRQLVDFISERVPVELADRVVIIDAADENPVGFNPLDAVGRNREVVVDGILSAFKAVFEDGWGPRTEDLLHAGLLSLATAGESRGEPYTLLDLPRLLTDAPFRRSVIGAIAGDQTLASFWAGFEELSPGARAQIIAAPMNKLRKFVLRKNLAAVLGQPRPRFRVRDVFRDGKAVLVPLNDALLGPGAAQLLGSLVVAELWMATLERAAETRPLDRPAAIYIDEVQQFLHLPTSIADALATSRSYGVSWNLAHQFRDQLPAQMRAAFDANARNKVVFGLGPDDARDLARMAPGLVAEDFMALKPYDIYANVVDDGAPAGWFSARTLTPTAALHDGHIVRQRSRDQWGQVSKAELLSVPESGDQLSQTASVVSQKARRS